MATAQENLARFNEIHKRGLADKLPPNIRLRYDEALKRGLIGGDENVSRDSVGPGTVSAPSIEQQRQPVAGGSPRAKRFQKEETERQTESTVGEKLLGATEVAGSVVSGVVAEPIAGLMGLAATANPFLPEGAGSRAVEETRQAITFQPRTEQGEEKLEGFGEALKPIGEGLSELEKDLGGNVFKLTGSKELATIAHTLPTAMLEILGVAAAKGAAKVPGTVAKKAKSIAEKQGLMREIADAAPTSQMLRDTATKVFDEIDETGTTLRPRPVRMLVDKLEKEGLDRGLDVDVTPKSAKALERFKALTEADSVSLRDVERARAVAQNAAASIDAPEKALGTRIINSVDDFLDDAGTNIFDKGATADIGKKYRTARKLWGQARRSELLQEAVTKAKDQATGFENGLRVQIRSIINNKKQRKFFNKDELSAMKRVVQGTKGANLAKLFGRLGFSESQATNIVGGALGAGAGAAVFGAPGAVAVPLLGNMSRKLAQRLTAKNAAFADQVIRAGKDAEKIAKVYIRNTPKNLRSSDDLSQLLMRPDVDLGGVSSGQFDGIVDQAVQKAAKNRKQLETLTGVTSSSAVKEESE